MRPNIMLSGKAFLVNTSSVKLNTNSIRTHVKISPWRTLRNKRECYLDNTEKPYTDRHNPAEFMREKKQLKPWQRVVYKDKDGQYNDYVWHDSYISDHKKAKETALEKFEQFKGSLNLRGQARESKPYKPHTDVEQKIIEIFKSVQSQLAAIGDNSSPNESSNHQKTDDSSILSTNLDKNRTLKFNLIVNCIATFEHDLPCSYLNDILTVKDLVGYFSTPVRGINPYDNLMKHSDSLPPNLSLLPEPFRYDMENDSFFGGRTAYPGLVSQISGLRAKKKFPVLNQKEFQWPDV